MARPLRIEFSGALYHMTSWVTAANLQFGKRRDDVWRKYARPVAEGIRSRVSELRQQIYLGDDKFVTHIQRKAAHQGDELSIPRAQRRPPVQSINKIAANYPERNEAIVAAYSTGIYSAG